MPVLDQVQDDGSGIQCQNSLKKHWIPGQARNDKKRMMHGFVNYDTASQGMGSTISLIEYENSSDLQK